MAVYRRGMTVQRWNLERHQDPAPSGNVGLEARISLETALAANPDPEAWSFWAHGEPVATLAEFKRLASIPGDTKPDAFVARAPGLKVSSL